MNIHKRLEELEMFDKLALINRIIQLEALLSKQQEATEIIDQIEQELDALCLRADVNTGSIYELTGLLRRELSKPQGDILPSSVLALLELSKQEDTEILDYDCGLLGGDDHQTTEWWHDYIRSELSACNYHWKSQLNKE